MNLTLKIAAGACTAVAAAGGGCYLALSGFARRPAKITPRAEENADKRTAEGAAVRWTPNAQTDYGKPGAIGRIYGPHLLDAGDSNEPKWNELWGRWARDGAPRSLLFSDITITRGFSSSSETEVNTSLNKQCAIAYGRKVESNLENSENTEGKIYADDGDWKTLWKYCSPWDPKFVGAEETGDGTVGRAGAHELLAAGEGDNVELWNSKNAAFAALSSAPASQHFRNLYDRRNSQSGGNVLRSGCGEAYRLETGSKNAPTTEEVLKYCSMRAMAQP